jgi:hypothetical protein
VHPRGRFAACSVLALFNVLVLTWVLSMTVRITDLDMVALPQVKKSITLVLICTVQHAPVSRQHLSH